MTIGTLVLNIGIVAIILTAAMIFLKRQAIKSYLMSLLQNFCGVLFIFSGWVKAVDPLGTAYKMEQYFDEFYTTFEGTWFNFIAPVYPLFSKYAIWFSVFMIVFEIVLGIMLLIGARTKFTAWAFMILVAFFTILTGFTFLTGYVPGQVNFFQFSQWTEFNANNMKVQDCGCFGDFIKLEPRVSFFKDIFLLIPSLFFVFRHKDMHSLFNAKVRDAAVLFSTLVLLVYCFSNYVWDIPHTDFRPFKKSADVRSIREAEENAMAAVQITDWKLKNKETSEVITVPNDEYMSNYSSKYRGVYEVVEQIKGEPAIKPTKISDFEITDLDGNDLTDDILYSEKALFLIVNYSLKGQPERATRIVQDSVFVTDTVTVVDMDSYEDSTYTVKSFKGMEEREESYVNQNWNKAYVKKHVEQLKPFTDAAKNDGFRVLMAVGKSDPEAIMDFDKATGLDIEYGMADDILLKTIVRSNPGVVLWEGGKILDKWHIRKLPEYTKVKAMYLE
jgi:uncharacterized membrane protein YphA (DoxX/SURF4 family)